MRQLRGEDSADKHRRAVRYHMGACRRSPNLPLCVTLRQEADVVYKALRTKTREMEDAQDELIDLSAEADAVEEALEAVLRDLHQDLGRLDRDNPALNLQLTAFPDGLGEILEPKGQAQLDTVVSLMDRLKSNQAQQKVAEVLKKLEQASAVLQSALDAEEKAERTAERIAIEEAEARKAVREQLNSAHGQLRTFFKTNPARAERFFLRESGGARRVAPPPATAS
jgi:tRNA/tmRNA/rRNA uracil-C5-methylase (TrmA/RlmC/RlmD family)